MKQESFWREVFEKGNPAPPEGFAARQDALLRRLTTGQQKAGKQSLLLRPLIALAFVLVTVGALAAGNILGLGDFFRGIGTDNQARIERLDAFREGTPPFEATQSGVRVTLHELISDGRWMYASAMLEPVTNGVLPVPFGEVGERPHGLTAEGDTRDYAAYARDEGLRLVSISVYMESEAMSGDYFMDHAYDEQGRLMLYMGGETPEGGRADYRLRIITTEDGREKLDQQYQLSVAVRDEAVTRMYPANLPVGDTGVILKEARLTLTALCAYLDVTLQGDTWLHADMIRDGDFWPRELSISVNGYEMDALPDQIDVRLEHPRTGETWDFVGLKGE